MTWGYVAVAAATVVGGYMSSQSQKSAARSAAAAQGDAAAMQVDEASRQFDEIQKLLAPYNSAGTSALTAQSDLLGLNGAGAQSGAIKAIANGPQMAALTKQGENSLLQNASATGGLRGGNLQGALAQFRPQLLSQLIQQQFGNLGGLTSVGQNAAAGTGNAGMQTSAQIQNAYGQMGAANAGAALAAGQANSSMWNNMSNTASMMGMLKLMGKF